MAISYDTLLGFFTRGHFLEALRYAEPSVHRRPVDPRCQVLVARCLFHVGKTDLAGSVAESIVTSDVSIESRAASIQGLVGRRHGDLKAAAHHFHNALASAQATRDAKQEGWTRLHLFRMAIGRSANSNETTSWDQLRRVVVRAADPHLTVALHETAAIAEGQKGNIRGANTHVTTGRSLLEAYPSDWLTQALEVAEGCLALVQFDLESADAHFKEAKRLGNVTGSEACLAAARVNAAHIALFRGQVRSASALLEATPTEAPPSAELAALEGMARIQLALNSDSVQVAIDRVREHRLSGSSPYSVRWAGLTQCKLLHRQGRHEELFRTLAAEEAAARKFGDNPLLAALRLVRAEAAAATNDLPSAGRALLDAAELGIAANPELQGHFHLSVGRVLEMAHVPASGLFHARALRFWRHRRNVLALIEAESFGKPTMPLADYDRDPRFAGRPVQTSVVLPDGDRPLAVLDSIANAIEMSGSPLLLAEELRQLAEHVGVSSQVRVHSGRSAAETVEGTYAVDLGTERNQHVSLICSPANRVSDNVALSGITRVARSAVTLERLRSEERDRAALWPTSHQELEGALYIDEQMTSLLATARKVAAVNVPVLITGETGTGKEVLARTIHAASGRAGGAMVPFNCASCPKDMIDAQLFGHRRGAFTGAVESAPGVIRAAAGGTLFLDEIGDAPLDIQPKLLRFLESGEVHPIGEPRPSKVDVRIIAATNVDLVAAVSASRFREDLYYRLNIVTLHIPPLRERRSEIPVLANYYLQQCAMEHRKGRLRLAEETVEYLLLYRWPGNVRQLANEIRRMAALAENDQVLMPEHLSPEIATSRRTIPPSERPLDVNEIAIRIDQPMAAAIEHVERAMVVQALAACGGRVEDTARRLGLSRKGLYLKRLRFGMESTEPQQSQWA